MRNLTFNTCFGNNIKRKNKNVKQPPKYLVSIVFIQLVKTKGQKCKIAPKVVLEQHGHVARVKTNAWEFKTRQYEYGVRIQTEKC